VQPRFGRICEGIGERKLYNVVKGVEEKKAKRCHRASKKIPVVRERLKRVRLLCEGGGDGGDTAAQASERAEDEEEQ